MSNSNEKKIKSTLHSGRLVVPLVAILLLTNFQIGTRPVSAVDVTVTTVVTLDPATAAPLTGELQHLNTSTGENVLPIDPHVDCNLVAYSVFDPWSATVRYLNVLTNTELVIPNQLEGWQADVSGNRIARTDVIFEGTRIKVFDVSANTDVVVPGGRFGLNPAIGGDLVAFEDRSDWGQSWTTEIQAYDLGSNTLTQLTNDSTMRNLDPAVSPTGNVVAFHKCDISSANCDIYSAVQTAPGAFNVSQLTGPAAEESNVDTNGTLVVYESLSNGDRDIAYQPISGASETRLSIPGFQRNPSISGSVISFESSPTEFGNYDLFLYDTATNRLFRPVVPAGAKVMNDITFCGGQFRVVYGSDVNFELHEYAFTFQLPESTSDEIDDLIALVRSFELTDGAENSLIAKLESALDALDAGDTATACASLGAFVNEVQAQADKKIPAAQANQLINSANQIQQELGCQ